MKQCRSGITKHKLWSVGLDEVSAFFSSPAPALPHSRAGRDRAALPVCMKVTIPLGISTYFCLHSSLRFLTQPWNTVVFAFWALHSVRFESARCTKHLSNIIPFSNNFYVHLPCSQVTWKWEMESKLRRIIREFSFPAWKTSDLKQWKSHSKTIPLLIHVSV